jgi:hypothetical protein
MKIKFQTGLRWGFERQTRKPELRIDLRVEGTREAAKGPNHSHRKHERAEADSSRLCGCAAVTIIAHHRHHGFP